MEPNCHSFLISGEKQERSLYILLMEFHRLKYYLLVTKKDKIFSSSGLTRTHRLSPCSHKEADTRGPAHLQDIVLHDHSVIGIRTVDTDWILIALSQIHYLTPELEKSYVELGTGKDYRQVYILCKTINITQFLLSDLDFNTA